MPSSVKIINGFEIYDFKKKGFCYNSLMCMPTSGFMNMHNLKVVWLSSVSWYLKFRNVEFSWKAQYSVEYPYENGSVRGKIL